jgi:hypothetical protein
MLNTIHVALVSNGASVKRPLRVYSADTFGVVVKGQVHAVKALTHNTVALVKGAMPKAKTSCRAAKLVDLGIAKSAKPLPEFIAERQARKAAKAQAAEPAAPQALKLTPELVAQLVAMLSTAHA